MARAMRVIGMVAVTAMAIVAGSRMVIRMASGVRAAPNGTTHTPDV